MLREALFEAEISKASCNFCAETCPLGSLLSGASLSLSVPPGNQLDRPPASRLPALANGKNIDYQGPFDANAWLN